jgi:Rad3-related DNA helicase
VVPSYAFLENVLDAFCGICRVTLLSEDPVRTWREPAAETKGRETSEDSEEMFVLAQKREMTDTERAAFLQAFEDTGTDRRLIGFCVLGGMFGEGIDLRSDRLIGSLIVGTGLPPVEPQRELLQEYFTGQGRNGYDFAYRFPGMNKVLQAAGRVIRTAEDVGIVVLMDGRFSESSNRELFPVEWGQPEAVASEAAAERIRRFWEECCRQEHR